MRRWENPLSAAYLSESRERRCRARTSSARPAPAEPTAIVPKDVASAAMVSRALRRPVPYVGNLTLSMSKARNPDERAVRCHSHASLPGSPDPFQIIAQFHAKSWEVGQPHVAISLRHQRCGDQPLKSSRRKLRRLLDQLD